MNLMEQIKKDEEELQKRMEQEDGSTENVPEPEEEQKEDDDEEGGDELSPDTPSENTEEPEIPADAPKDHKVWAEMRRELRNLKKQVAEKSAPKEETKVEVKQPSSNDPEPNSEEDPIAHLQWRVRQADKKAEEALETARQQAAREREVLQRQAAVNEFIKYEEKFKSNTSDYEAVSQNALVELKKSFRNIVPGLDENTANQMAADHILTLASRAAQQGLDPAEELYHTFKDQFGVPQPKEEKKKINLQKIEKSQKKSASPLMGGGQGGNSVSLTLQSLEGMTNQEFSMLTPSQLRELEAQAY